MGSPIVRLSSTWPCLWPAPSGCEQTAHDGSRDVGFQQPGHEVSNTVADEQHDSGETHGLNLIQLEHLNAPIVMATPAADALSSRLPSSVRDAGSGTSPTRKSGLIAAGAAERADTWGLTSY